MKGGIILFSVTGRISFWQQPRLGYIPPRTLKAEEYFDSHQLNRIAPTCKSIQGMAVDYLTRYMRGTPKHIAFQISLMGAKNVDELDKATCLLNKINGLDGDSICAACQLVGYDVAYRRGPRYFTPIEKIKPSQNMVQNIIILVNRSLAFLKRNGPVVLDGFTFEGGYNDIISRGDGDYLTADTLWDFKVSNEKPTARHTLQILIYYILGIHSIHPEFQDIKKLGIFNPERNTAYTIALEDITNETFQTVSRDVIGYCTPKDAKQWRTATGTSVTALNKVKAQFAFLFKDTDFSPDNFGDGIHDITIDDYWSYYRKFAHTLRPTFSRTHSVKFIKNSGFFMFVSISEKGVPCVLQGGALRRLERPLQYYYNRLPEYAATVLQKFSKYWDALYSISKQIQSVAFDDKDFAQEYEQYKVSCKEQGTDELDFETWRQSHGSAYRFSGNVHGCIVDIDYFNHIYLNPYDGSIAPYYAPSMYMKYVYKNVPSLIAEHRPEMLPAFNRAIEASTDKETTALVLADSAKNRAMSILSEQEIDTYNMPVTDTSMYEVSNRLKLLQAIYDHKLVVVWHDNILPHYELEGE